MSCCKTGCAAQRQAIAVAKVITLSLGLVSAHSVLARAQTGLEAESEAAEKKTQRPDYLEEVLVTAQKRAESVQEVPLAVSVMSAERIQASAMENFEDIALATPNTDVNMTPGYVQVGMRGLNAPINDGMEQSVGFYVDGIYYGKTAFLQDAFLDLERVEMLKGPQGTLFGKNTIAGAVNVTTAKPSDEWEASLSHGRGDYNNEKWELMLNAPLGLGSLSERLALRIAATRHQRDGYVDNLVRDTDEKRTDKEGLRSKLRFDVSERHSLVLSYYEGEARDNGQGWEPFLLQGDAELVHGAFNPDLEADFDYRGHANTENFSISDSRFVNLQWDWDLPGIFEGHQFSAIYGKADLHEHFLLDADTASAPIAFWDNQDDYQQEMLELRLVSPPGTLEYIVGAFAFRSDYDAFSELRAFDGAFSSDSLLTVLNGFLPGVANNPLVDLLAPLTDNLNALLNAPASDALFQTFIQSTETEAIFGQATWNINDRWSVILGLRASRESKEIDLRQEYEETGLMLQAAFGVSQYSLVDERDESNVAPRLSVKYQTETGLFYFTYGEGFKAGGFNPLARNEGEAVFEQETAVAYELGYKHTALGGALTANAALFRTQFEDMQIQSFIGNGFIVRNAAEATTEGLELEFNWFPAPGTVLYAGAGYTRAVFDSFTEGPCQSQPGNIIPMSSTCDLTGARLPRAPVRNASAGFNAAMPLWEERLAMVLGADISWRDDIFLELDQDPIDTQPAEHLINARLGLVDPNERWRLLAHVKNLENKKVRQFAADMPIFGGSHMGFLLPPRTLSLEFGLRF